MAGKMVQCQNCGAENGHADVFCYKCGVRMEGENARAGPVPLWTGILLFMIGGMGFFSWLMIGFLGKAFASNPVTAEAAQFLTYCGIVGMLLSIVPVFCGFLSLRRNFWGAVAGAVVGLFLVGPYLLCSLMSVIVLVLVLMSRRDFRFENLDWTIR